MPKIVSEREKELIYEAIYQSAIKLIRKKGLKRITVDDIANEANIAKGSFYKYYSSKEICLYEVSRRSEREMFNRMESVLSESKPSKELITKLFHEVYLADDSLVLYVEPKELEAFLRKLPPEYSKKEKVKSEGYFERSLQLLGIDNKMISMSVLGHLLDSLCFIASKNDGSPECKEAMELIINSIAEYFAGGMTQRDV